MQALQKQAEMKFGGEIVPMYSPKGRSASNGVAEKAVHEVEALFRTVLLALESRIGAKLDLTLPICFWMIEYAAELINRVKVRERDGLTAYHRKIWETRSSSLVRVW